MSQMSFGDYLIIIVAIIFVSFLAGRVIRWLERKCKQQQSGIPFSIPGEGLRPTVMPTAEEMEGESETKPPTRFLRRGADGKMHPVTNILERHFSNGSALAEGEKGQPIRISRQCLRCS